MLNIQETNRTLTLSDCSESVVSMPIQCFWVREFDVLRTTAAPMCRRRLAAQDEIRGLWF